MSASVEGVRHSASLPKLLTVERESVVKHFKNMLGTLMLFSFMLGTAWMLTKWPMSFDRALGLTILAALAQVRWFQEDKSPVGKPGE